MVGVGPGLPFRNFYWNFRIHDNFNRSLRLARLLSETSSDVVCIRSQPTIIYETSYFLSSDLEQCDKLHINIVVV